MLLLRKLEKMASKINDAELSCNGIDMLVNNDLEGCEKLFLKHKLVNLVLIIYFRINLNNF